MEHKIVQARPAAPAATAAAPTPPHARGTLADALLRATPPMAAALLANVGAGQIEDHTADAVHDAALRVLLREVVGLWATTLGLQDPLRPLPPTWAASVPVPAPIRAAMRDAVAACFAGPAPSDPTILGDAYAAQLDATAELDDGRLVLHARAGSRRRSSGAFHTPAPLVELLLDVSMPALLARATTRTDVLALRVCDPAAGGGALLLAAAHRLAGRLLTLPPDPAEGPDSPVLTEAAALSTVIARCLRGADRDPLAAELTRIALWLGASDSTISLSAFDAQIVVGDGLLGTGLDGAGPPVASDGSRGEGPVLPGVALRSRPLEGRDQLGTLRRRSRQSATTPAATPAANPVTTPAVSPAATPVTPGPSTRPALSPSEAQLVADAWCAAWTAARDTPDAVAPYDVLDAVQAGDAPPPRAVAAVAAEAARTRPLHWHLAFPDIAAAGGFDLVLANPPWERLRLQQKRWFARVGRRDVAGAASAAIRRARIAALDDGDAADRAVADAWRAAQRDATARASFLRDSGRFPLTGRGDVNAYAAFAERCLDLTAPHGRTAIITPSGLLTDLGTAPVPRLLVDEGRLTDVIGFADAGQHFAGVGTVPFAVLAAAGSAGADSPTVRLASGLGEVEGWQAASFEVDRAALGSCNPDTRTLVPARNRPDLELAIRLHRTHPILQRVDQPPRGAEAAWNVRFLRPFDMTNDAGLFSREPAGRLPLLEGKLVGLHDHRANRMTGPTTTEPDTQAATDPDRVAGALRFVAAEDVASRTPARPVLLVVRLINGRATSRTLVAALTPRVAVGNSLAVIDTDPRQAVLLAGLLCSLPLDHVLRTKIEDANINLFVLRQLPLPLLASFGAPAPWEPMVSLGSWMARRVVALAAASRPVALGLGLDEPVVVDAATRQAWRDDLDAAAFHLYGHTRDEVAHVLGTFAGVARAEAARGAPGRTARAVLARYDAFAAGDGGIATLDGLPALPQALTTPIARGPSTQGASTPAVSASA